MKKILIGVAFALTATVAHAQGTAMEIATAQVPAPCGGVALISSAEFVVTDSGANAVRVVCVPGAAGGGAAPGAPATGFVPLVGVLGPVLGIGAVAAAVGLGGGDGGSSTSDTQ